MPERYLDFPSANLDDEPTLSTAAGPQTSTRTSRPRDPRNQRPRSGIKDGWIDRTLLASSGCIPVDGGPNQPAESRPSPMAPCSPSFQHGNQSRALSDRNVVAREVPIGDKPVRVTSISDEARGVPSSSRTLVRSCSRTTPSDAIAKTWRGEQDVLARVLRQSGPRRPPYTTQDRPSNCASGPVINVLHIVGVAGASSDMAVVAGRVPPYSTWAGRDGEWAAAPFSSGAGPIWA